jgi:hypothetical protein
MPKAWKQCLWLSARGIQGQYISAPTDQRLPIGCSPPILSRGSSRLVRNDGKLVVWLLPYWGDNRSNDSIADMYNSSLSSIKYINSGPKLGNKLLITKLFGKKVIKKRKIFPFYAFFA